MQQQPKAVTVRFSDRRLAESAEIMASILGLSLNDYLVELINSGVTEDVLANVTVFEAVRAAREKQQKGA